MKTVKNKTTPPAVCVMGLGYVGLPTAGFLAGRGYNVLGVDIQPDIVKTINAGETHVHEPDLENTVRDGVTSGCLRAAANPAPSDIFIITVPTPVNHDLSPDISSVKSAMEMIAPHVAPGNLVIIESTCPVGTTEAMADLLRRSRPDIILPQYSKSKSGAEQDDKRIFMSYCPERNSSRPHVQRVR